MIYFTKDPDAILDYIVDWTQYLNGDTISSSSFTVASGMTKTLESNTSTTATVWVAGGHNNSSYEVTNSIVTAGGRSDQRTFTIVCQEL